jgi:hypothetical protein
VIDEEAVWAQALAEFDSSDRRPGLWAKSYADAGGSESAAKAYYLRARVGVNHPGILGDSLV